MLSGNPRRARIAGLLVGGAATVCMAAAGCTATTDGDPTANGGDAPLYRTSMSVSSSRSVASSSASESERRASMTTQAVHTTCETLSTTSADAIDAVNDYVRDFNTNRDSNTDRDSNSAGDPAASEAPAVDSLRRSADAVEKSITDIVPDEMTDAFMEWVDGARITADAITRGASPSEFNQIINDLNGARSDVLRLCDATY